MRIAASRLGRVGQLVFHRRPWRGRRQPRTLRRVRGWASSVCALDVHLVTDDLFLEWPTGDVLGGWLMARGSWRGGRRVKCSVMRGAAALMELMMEFQG